jgi:hypothetical protein
MCFKTFTCLSAHFERNDCATELNSVSIKKKPTPATAAVF